jgi:predicted HD phosphohydrolase
MAERAAFTSMERSTREEWQRIIEPELRRHARGLGNRVLDHLRLLAGDAGGFPVDRFQHSLQTATLAHRAGEDEEYVVCALLHDIGDTLGSYDHPAIAAAILGPFVSEENHWMVAHHGIFQGYYFFHHLGLDRNLREQYRGHPCFERTALFCERYDNKGFDTSLDTMPLEAFEPMVRRLFEKPRHTIYRPRWTSRARRATFRAARALLGALRAEGP